jgi:hypothetical protein
MKKQIAQALPGMTGTIIFYSFDMISINRCQKDINQNSGGKNLSTGSDISYVNVNPDSSVVAGLCFQQS